MKHCTPIYHPLIIVALFGFFGVVFVPIGFTLMNQADKLIEITKIHKNGENNDWQIDIPADELNVNKPLNLYYQLDDFHQNVRSYADSYDIKQLTTSSSFKSFGYDENCTKTSDPTKILDEPCGLIWKTRVQDTYQMSIYDPETNQNQTLNFDMDILRKSDIDSNRMFGQTFKQMNNWQIYGAWMRPAAFPLVTKSYGKISQGQWANKTIINNKNQTVYRFTLRASGDYQYKEQRKIILTQMTSYGGKSETKNLGILSTVFGFISFVCALLFIVIYFIWKKSQPAYQKMQDELEQESIKHESELKEDIIEQK